MCDKLQTSKDGSVDLCHSQLAEYGTHSIQQRSSPSLNKKHRKNSSKGKGPHRRTGSEWSGNPSNEKVHRPHHDEQVYSLQGGSSRGQRWPKTRGGRQGSSENGVNRHAKMSAKKECSNDFLAPIGSRGGQSRRKKLPSTSLNHLLNFTITSTERRYSGGGGVPPVTRHRRRNTSHSYNKEEFLQANCQFVVSASGDYTFHFGDPDKLVEWESIEQVRLFCHQIPSCPICLYPPRAAKITRCGHVYCWSCLLHYLSLTEKKWSKCPICNESIYRKDVKSVAALSSPQYKVGDTITMKLMAREKRATLVFPKADWNDNKMLSIEDSSVNQFAKLLSASPAQALSLITGPEKRSLQSQLAGLGEDEATEECFIQAALEDLKVRELELMQAQAVHFEVEKVVTDCLLTTPALQPSDSPEPPSLSWTSYSDLYFEGGYEPPFSEPEEDSSDSGQSLDDNSIEKGKEVMNYISPNNSLNASCENFMSPSSESSPRSYTSETSNSSETSPSKANLVYFYQASDGQHLYMHPINTKCLSKEHGGLEYCPDEITATVVEMEQFTMSEDIRRRYRSLSHLPLTCELALCELELKPPTVSQDTLDLFAGEVQRRRQKRIKKMKDERRREKRAEARSPQAKPTYQVPSTFELTPEKLHDFLSLASSPSLLERRSLEGTDSHHSDSSEVKDGLTNGTAKDGNVPSFAQALLQSKSPVWPVKLSSKDLQPKQSDVVKCYDEEDGSSVPSFQDAFNKAFQTASESVMAAHKAAGGKPGNKTAKKGRKKLVLFTTGGSRGTV